MAKQITSFPETEIVMDLKGYSAEDTVYYKSLQDIMNFYGMTEQGINTMKVCGALSVHVGDFLQNIGDVALLTEDIANLLLQLDQICISLGISDESLLDKKLQILSEVYDEYIEDKEEDEKAIDDALHYSADEDVARLTAMKYNR